MITPYLYPALHLTPITVARMLTVETPRQLIDLVAAAWGITYSDITGNRRYITYTQSRQLAMFLLTYRFTLTTTVVAHLLNRKKHTSTLHAIKQVNNWWDTDMVFRGKVVGLMGRGLLACGPIEVGSRK